MRVKSYFLLMITVVMAVACTTDIAPEERLATTDGDGAVYPDDQTPVQFTIKDQNIVDFTRSVTSIITFNAGEQVNVRIKPQGKTAYTLYEFTAHQDGQSGPLDPPEVPPFFPAGEYSYVEAYAYYPASATADFSVKDDQTADADYKASDLMFAAHRIITKNVDDGNNVLTMAHQMAQLHFNVSAQIGTGLTVSGVTVDAQKNVIFTPEAETVTTTVGARGTIKALNAAGEGYVVIPPQPVEGLLVKVMTGNGTPAETASYLFHSTGNFIAGSSYGLNIVVTQEHLGKTSIISDWEGINSVNVTPSGDLYIEPINAQEIQYDGQEHTPAVKVTYNNTLIDSGDYTTQYVNNVNAGRAFVIVVGKDGTAIEGCVGIASFTIAQANAFISYGEEPIVVNKTYGNPNFTQPLSKTPNSDGKVTYTSSNPEVAMVNSVTGEVTILKAGTTTISATVENGANYVYAEPKTVSYTLNVQPATGAISFGTATPSKTWSATAANNTFRQDVINTGTAPVTYTLGDVNTCGATIDGSTISFTKSGIVLVKATVVNDDKYNYSQTEATYVLTVNKANGYVSLTATSGSVRAGSSAIISVNSSHGGTLSAAATSGATGRIESVTGPANEKFTVLTNGTASSSATITVTCGANDYYNAATATYTLTIETAIDVMKLPLYYVAQHNVSNLKGDFATTPNAGYFFNWRDAMSRFAAQTTSYSDYRTAGKGPNGQWHLPVQAEWWGIAPSTKVMLINYDNGAGTLKRAYIRPIWGYNNMTKKQGVLESAYWKKINNGEMHAIRFLGTEFCSAWKYKFSADRTYVVISATLINSVSESEAATWYVNNFSKVAFGNNPSIGAVERTFYHVGCRRMDEGTGPKPSYYQGQWVFLWSATQDGDRAWHYESGMDYRVWTYSYSKNYGFNVRLFLDN